jgi:hypothetical protein
MSQAVRHNSDNRFLPVKFYFKSYTDLETAGLWPPDFRGHHPDPEGRLRRRTL